MHKNKKILWLLLAVTSTLLWLTAIVLWISIPEEKTLNIATTICAMAIFLITLMMRKSELKVFYESQRFKYFSTNVVTVFLVLCILALINYLAYKNPYQWDLTPNKSNTLTAQTRQVLSKMEGAIEAIVFSPKAQQEAIEKILELYQIEKRSITVKVYDPNLRPELVQEYGLTRPLAVVWQKDEKRQIVTQIDELGLTNGLIRLSRDRLPKIYFDTGHGQTSLTDNGQTGRAILRQNLVESNFIVQEVDTKRWEQVPEDADVLMLWGPKKSFMPKELEIFKAYLDKGGKMLVALDPDLNGDPVKEMRQFLVEQGVIVSNALVIDTLSHISGSNGTVPIAASFSDKSAITKNFPGQAFFPLTGFLSLGEQAKGTPLVFSSAFPAAWAEMSNKDFVKGKVAYDDKIDVKGPLAFAAVVETKSGARLGVFANSTFVDNAYAKYAANHILVLNTLNWLTGDDQLISFDLAAINNEPVFISSPQLGVIFFFSVVLVPLSLFAIAIWNYRRRRVL